jgi:hypothetical protein
MAIFLPASCFVRVVAEHLALLLVVGHHAEGGLEALLRVFRIGRRGRDLRRCRRRIQLGGGNRGAGVEVADDAIHLGVDQLLRHRRALFRIGLVVLAEQFEGHHGAADFQLLGIGFLDGQAGAVFVVLAQVRLRTGERCRMADLHGQRGLGRRRGRLLGLRRRRGRRRFLAAAVHDQGGSDGEAECLDGESHGGRLLWI